MPSVLFVCTANINRSPLAAALFQKLLADSGRADGWRVESAGTWAEVGRSASSASLRAAQAFGINLLMQDVKRDGRPHSAVGIDVTSQYVRAGVASAYPHPNQFFHSRIERGKTVYVNTDILLGGFGGECYRNYLIAPWTPAQERLWEVVAETVLVQERMSKAGASAAADLPDMRSLPHGLSRCPTVALAAAVRLDRGQQRSHAGGCA